MDSSYSPQTLADSCGNPQTSGHRGCHTDDTIVDNCGYTVCLHTRSTPSTGNPGDSMNTVFDSAIAEKYWDEEEPELLLQPETRPISHDQLVAEVKSIYAGLVLVEAKCIDIDEKQLRLRQDLDSQTSRQPPLTAEQWSALTALHKTLLHEHHDFFLASQHPAASQALTKLAEKYSMPARMWKHGIHAFLDVLRHRLPDSFDFMVSFLNISYSMMALLYETIPMFEATWIECLGDLGRYRMALPDFDEGTWGVWPWEVVPCQARWHHTYSSKNRLSKHIRAITSTETACMFQLYIRALGSNFENQEAYSLKTDLQLSRHLLNDATLGYTSQCIRKRERVFYSDKTTIVERKNADHLQESDLTTLIPRIITSSQIETTRRPRFLGYIELAFLHKRRHLLYLHGGKALRCPRMRLSSRLTSLLRSILERCGSIQITCGSSIGRFTGLIQSMLRRFRVPAPMLIIGDLPSCTRSHTASRPNSTATAISVEDDGKSCTARESRAIRTAQRLYNYVDILSQYVDVYIARFLAALSMSKERSNFLYSIALGLSWE